MSALQELAANTERMFGVFCRVEHGHPVRLADLATATHLYRVAQEAASNATKHGKGTVITIELKQLGEQLVIEISDDGAGLPTGRSRSSNSSARAWTPGRLPIG